MKMSVYRTTLVIIEYDISGRLPDYRYYINLLPLYKVINTSTIKHLTGLAVVLYSLVFIRCVLPRGQYTSRWGRESLLGDCSYWLVTSSPATWLHQEAVWDVLITPYFWASSGCSSLYWPCQPWYRFSQSAISSMTGDSILHEITSKETQINFEYAFLYIGAL